MLFVINAHLRTISILIQRNAYIVTLYQKVVFLAISTEQLAHHVPKGFICNRLKTPITTLQQYVQNAQIPYNSVNIVIQRINVSNVKMAMN